MCKPIDQSKYCLFCSFTGKIHFILRGLPESNEINSHYVFMAGRQKLYKTSKSYSVKLEGYLDYDMKWNKEPDYWYIEAPTNMKIASLRGYGSSPFGKKEWNMSINGGSSSTILKLSIVSNLLCALF